MSELTEDMYCSQQINIPPTFPYLLRQYAKAAIRTQPSDLLRIYQVMSHFRWSAAYFRCLSLNLAPPVKPRLEYPIPKTHYGLTPGWLRALLYQLQRTPTVSFKLLWDRWIGACLEHDNLIELLCLGRFTNPAAIPWYRFLGLCASRLNENLTQTMIMVCEILTEEPEGGSAMVPLEVFCDVYKFLAEIDASEPQTLYNLYFTDSLLSLYRDPKAEKAKEVRVVEEKIEEKEKIEEEEEEMVEEEEIKIDDTLGMVISCPDIATDEFPTEELPLPPEVEEEEEMGAKPESAEEEKESETTEVIKAAISVSSSTSSKVEEEEEELRQPYWEQLKEDDLREMEELSLPCEEEQPEEMDSDIIRLKQALDEQAEYQAIDEGIEEEERAEDGRVIYIDAIPGIGPTVPTHLVEAVVEYMEEVAARQHGMVMPRNIRHYTCPPLEVVD